jgi:rubrerythrin
MNTGVIDQNATATAMKTTENRGTLNQETLGNLSTAMHGEAFAYVKYLLYAEHAREDGNKELTDLFEKTANIERFEHFAEEAQVAGLVSNDADNLNVAIKGESYEIDIMYLECAQTAKVAKDIPVADRFEEIRHDEMGHRDAFKIALAKLKSRKENLDATTNHRSAAVVRRRWRLLRVFQMGRTRGPGDSRDRRAHRVGIVFSRRAALTLSGSI